MDASSQPPVRTTLDNQLGWESALALERALDDRAASPLLEDISLVLQKQATRTWIQTAPLEDVCACLAALRRYRPQLVSGQDIAIIVSRLIKVEAAPGGPYKALESSCPITYNAAIALFIARVAGPLPNVIRYLQKQVSDKDIHLSERARAYISYIPELHHSTPVITARNYNPDLHKQRNDRIFANLQKELSAHGPEVARQSTTLYERLVRANKGYEITLLATYFSESLQRGAASPRLCQKLGLANLWCWLAYSAYDHILDGEASTAILPVANIAHRQALREYYKASNSKIARDTVYAAYNDMDQANAWECAVARAHVTPDTIAISNLPKYGNAFVLARRSYAHVLGPLIIAMRQTQATSSQILQLHTSFRHYIIARQLNDDAHDWADDLRSGQLTYVVTWLLRQKDYRRGTYDLRKCLNDLQQQFWNHTGQEVSSLVCRHINAARQALQKSKLVRSDSGMYRLYDRIERAAIGSEELRKDSLLFAHSFGK